MFRNNNEKLNKYFLIKIIRNEVIYRTQYDILDKWSIARLISTPNNIREFDIFKTIIDIKKIKINKS
jgi:hypothetical protein